MHKHAKQSLGTANLCALGSEWEQGFINTWGEFLTRKEAWIVAVHNSQIYHICGNQSLLDDIDADKELYSENLY